MNNELATITDTRTGEIIPAGATKEIAQPTYAVDYSKVGTIKIEPEQAIILGEPVSDTEIKIRPDGNLYVSWSFYASRLNKAFGVLQWGLIPDGKPMSKPGAYDDVLVAWGHWLVIKGVPVGYAIGETTYKANNNMMSYADACEGAKSSSLARNCKIFGASFDLWDAEFCAEWREKNAEKYKDNGKDKWRKKAMPKVVTVESSATTTTEPATVTPETPAQSLQGVNVSKPATQPAPKVAQVTPVQAQPNPMTLDEARARILPSGNTYDNLTTEQLTTIMLTAKLDDAKHAAKLIIDWRNAQPTTAEDLPTVEGIPV